MSLGELDPKVLLGVLAVAAALVAAAGSAFYWWRHRRPNPEEVERRRRAYVNQVGRIVEGRILEITEVPGHPPQTSKANGRRKLVLYSYSISGVTYETAQDITGLEARLHLDRLITGQPVSIKYDPSNPGNSILISDDWSGVQ